jgi:hypothetical protein
MPFSAFDDQTRKMLEQVLEGAIIVLEVTNKDALSDARRPETMARLTGQLASAAAEGVRSFEDLQLRALDAIE